MTTDIKISQELVQRIADHCKFWKDHVYLEAISDIEPELRALLAKSELADHCKQCAEAVKDWPESKRDCLGKIASHTEEPLGAGPATCGQCKASTADICNQNGCGFLESGNGEPLGVVEPIYQVCNGVDGWIDVDRLRYTACSLDPEEWEIRALYASPPAPHKHEWDINDHGTATVCSVCGIKSSDETPAPVAVELPERKQYEHQGLSHTDARADGWNACLDKVKEMNR